MAAGDCCRDNADTGLTPADRYMALAETERNPKLLEWLAAFGAISGVAVVVKAAASLPPVKSYFSNRREYKECGDKERDIMKAVMTSHMGKIIRQNGETYPSIELVPLPHINAPIVRKSHLSVTGRDYGFALDYLVSKGYLKEESKEDAPTYFITHLGDRFIGTFASKLSVHKFTETFKDAVQDAKIERLSVQRIEGTVHATVFGQPLGDPDALCAIIKCYPPAEQINGIVARAYVIGEDLPVLEGDTVYVQFDQSPYHIRTHEHERWPDKRFTRNVPIVHTGRFVVRDTRPMNNGIQEISLVPDRTMRPVRTDDEA